MACKEISVEVAFLTPDNKRQINFGLTKKCNDDDTSFWMIDFLLKEKKGDDFITRIEVHVKVGTDKEAKAKALAKTIDKTDSVPEAKAELLLGPIKDRASLLPAGTKKDKKLNNLLSKMVD